MFYGLTWFWLLEKMAGWLAVFKNYRNTIDNLCNPFGINPSLPLMSTYIIRDIARSQRFRSISVVGQILTAIRSILWSKGVVNIK